MVILGLSAFYHDSAAAIIRDGEIIAAAQEERFTRKKHDSNFPENAIDYCLREANITAEAVDHVAFYDKPFLKFERLMETYVAFAPRGFKSFSMAIPVWLREKLFQRSLIRNRLKKFSEKFDWDNKLLFSEHHQSHAASAFYPSPFESAAVLTMDGVGEWATTSLGLGKDNKLEMHREIHFPHSIGLLYSAFTYYTGFRVNSGEYKLMGLAPYGEPRFRDLILDNLIDLKADGTFRLNLEYFDFCTGLRMTNKKFDTLFGGPARSSETLLTQREMDLAASIQEVTEEIVLRLGRSIASETGEQNLCLAGGVALNCVANGKLLRDKAFKNIWIQPAAGDAGGALGAALTTYHYHLGETRCVSRGTDQMKGTYLGPEFSQTDIENRLTTAGAKFSTHSDRDVTAKTAKALSNGMAVGWFQGRMEFGPRALGGRSILGDPRSPSMQKTLNMRVKYRESFRPFAPSILREDLCEWFDLNTDSPYMLIVAEVHEKRRRKMTDEENALFGIEKLNVPRSEIPAVTHIDYSARVQTVHRETNPRYYDLLTTFKEKTGCPVLVNTSFNVRGEPIVCTPEDAYRCFMGSDIEMLVIGNCILLKQNQPKALMVDYKNQFALD